MLGVTKLLCSRASSSDVLRHGRVTSKLPSNLLQFSEDKSPVVVWNVTLRCNLHCAHCYSDSKDTAYSGELTTEEGIKLIDDLAAFKVPVIIYSGGDPLMRPDIFFLAKYARDKGIRGGLSCNGLLVDDSAVKKIKDAGFDYVGISIDGIGEVNDLFRGKPGAFKMALDGMRRCHDAGLKTGLRFTLNKRNYLQLAAMFDMLEKENIPRCYVSHLVYSGRGGKIIRDDLTHEETRAALDYIFDRTLDFHRRGIEKEIITGNNDADAVYLYMRILKQHPERAEEVYRLLKWRGGNSSGIALGNVDSFGNVHADQFWFHYTFGNVRERPFGQIWNDQSDPLMAGLKKKHQMVKGRCGLCKYMDICGGGMRVRAEVIYDDVWAHDPACYLTDEEIGLTDEMAAELGTRELSK